MTMLLSPVEWSARAGVVRGPLAGLADNLAATVDRLIATGVHIPGQKALLSRAGGRCGVDGALLDFDPWNASVHRCPQCGREYMGELHDRFRLYWYQLWLAERALHAAILWRLRGAAAHRLLAERLLDGYAEAYLQYPNRDNVLGPGRVFFSTYLESIWLLQLLLAADVLGDDDSTAPLIERVRERIVEPSVELIASYDEGGSNRQVWNDVAMLAAGCFLERPDLVDRALHGPSGLVHHLSHGLLRDGTWYEGENYHLFAHRGLWYGVTLAARAGLPLPADLVRRFDRGFIAPFLTSFPDLTLPSRRDSQHAITLRQPRFAELCELGLARGADPRLPGLLARLYSGNLERGQPGQDRTSADVERNLGATALDRRDLGWRSLLFAVPELPPAAPQRLPSVVLRDQGIAVFRRDGGEAMVALDYGHSGGGHGHPDRLDLLVGTKAGRWLDDMGTGSYVERALHWYRSTLAHNAPLANGASQPAQDGMLLAHDERGAAGWVVAVAELGGGVSARRTIVVLDGYLVDELRWRSDDAATLDLPLHVDAAFDPDLPWNDGSIEGGHGLEDGFEFLSAVQRASVPEAEPHRLRATRGGSTFTVWSVSDGAAEWWRAVAPGPPGTATQRFVAMRTSGRQGRIRSVMTWSDGLRDVRFGPSAIEIDLADGTRHLHGRTLEGWRVELHAGTARSSIDLAGSLPAPEEHPHAAHAEPNAAARSEPVAVTGTADFILGREHYRRSEQAWEEAGSPRSHVSLARVPEGLSVSVSAAASRPLRIGEDGAENRLDNEPADVNTDGIQLYLLSDGESGGWRLALRPEGRVAVGTIPGWGSLAVSDAQWRRTPEGYELTAVIPLPRADIDPLLASLDVLVNDIGNGRERRRGQLVMSGAAGEWTYLRGDRHDPARLIPFAFFAS